MAESLKIDWIVRDKIGVINGANPIESAGILKHLESVWIK